MSVPKWLAMLAKVGPLVLQFTPLAPIAPAVIAAIGEAEAMQGASGAAKLQHVKQIAVTAAAAVNAQAGHQEVDPALIDAAADHAISTTVDIVNAAHAARAEDAAEAASPSPAASSNAG